MSGSLFKFCTAKVLQIIFTNTCVKMAYYSAKVIPPGKKMCYEVHEKSIWKDHLKHIGIQTQAQTHIPTHMHTYPHQYTPILTHIRTHNTQIDKQTHTHNHIHSALNRI